MGIVGGCRSGPDAAVVGIYSYDAVRSEIPDVPGMPGIRRKLREVTGLAKVKLMSDHTFLIGGAEVIEGTWSYDDGQVVLQPEKGDSEVLVEGGRITADFEGNALVIRRETPLGRILVYLRKTG
jgi:hypothetical protein